MIETEEWRPVIGFEKYYSISNSGRLRRDFLRGKPRSQILLPTHSKGGYPSYYLHAGGKRWATSIHNMVAMHFIGPRPKGLHVAHLDGDNKNNRVENLRYVTPQVNSSHKLFHGTHLAGERHHSSAITENQALYYKFCHYVLGEKICDMARRLDLDQDSLGQRIKKTWRHLDVIIRSTIAAREALDLYGPPPHMFTQEYWENKFKEVGSL